MSQQYGSDARLWRNRAVPDALTDVRNWRKLDVTELSSAMVFLLSSQVKKD